MLIKLVRQQKISEKIQNSKEQIKNIKLKIKQYLKSKIHCIQLTTGCTQKKKWSVNIKISQQKLSKPKYSERLTEKYNRASVANITASNGIAYM